MRDGLVSNFMYLAGVTPTDFLKIESSKRKAEQLMNDMAKQGWEVVSVTYWNNFTLCLLITFVRER